MKVQKEKKTILIHEKLQYHTIKTELEKDFKIKGGNKI